MDPPSRAHHHPPRTSGGGEREDIWSEGATEALIEAWGDRYLQLSRGNLRQKDWKDVADAVNEHQDALGKPRKTDIQCKNRIDTVKKKYKLEKSKLGPSQWIFYSRIDDLIGTSSSSNPPTTTTAAAGLKKPPPQAPVLKPHQRSSITFTVKQRPRTHPNQVVYSGGSSSRSRVNSSPLSTESSRGDGGGEEDENDDDEEEEDEGLFRGAGVGVAKRRRLEDLADAGGGDGGVEGAFVELARAIVKFGEIYEKVESSKQQQMMELGRQRMEFAKELEFQRMQMFMDAQLELEKMKRPKSAAGKRS